MKVKQFLNYGEDLENVMNEWLDKNKSIEVIDIKYSISVFQESNSVGGAEPCNGALVIYREKV